MRILVACEFSGRVRDAFLDKGHDAYSCDLLPCESDRRRHFQMDVFEVIENHGPWDLMIAHPPCTYLTNAGVRHLSEKPMVGSLEKPHTAAVYGKERFRRMIEAAEFFNKLKNCDIPRIVIENPVPHHYAREIIGKYNQIIQPFEFGHGETKKTCLWLKNLPPLFAESMVSGRKPAVHWESPGEDRWKRRSRTYPGIAKAMANQWG